MSKISLIIKREYLTRVKKKSFIIMTILGPILMASVWVLPIVMANIGGDQKTIEVLDESGLFFTEFKDSEDYKFVFVFKELDSAKNAFRKSDAQALVYIPKTQVAVPEKAFIFSRKQAGIGLKKYVETVMKKEVESIKLAASGIDSEILESIKTGILVTNIKLDASGNEEKSYPEIRLALAWFFGILIYFFIFIFGAQVMRGVIEEKVNRIIEVIISSVKPMQLMTGKIVGIALVGLTQFLLWVVLSWGIVGIVQASTGFFSNPQANAQITALSPGSAAVSPNEILPAPAPDKDENTVAYLRESMLSVNYFSIILTFLFYFLGGYLLYAALFAAIGSAVDNETDTQQFMLPVSAPLIASLVLVGYVINNPDGSLAFWLSMVPFTSPIIMMARIPFGVPFWEVGLSMAALIGGFLFTSWFASRIYRVGILMYGKKVNYKELWKWFRFRS